MSAQFLSSFQIDEFWKDEAIGDTWSVSSAESDICCFVIVLEVKFVSKLDAGAWVGWATERQRQLVWVDLHVDAVVLIGIRLFLEFPKTLIFVADLVNWCERSLCRAVRVSPLPPGQSWAVFSSKNLLDPVDVLFNREWRLVDVKHELIQVDSLAVFKVDLDEGVAFVVLVGTNVTANDLIRVWEN